MSGYIQFKNVKKKYKMGEVEIEALSGVDFSVNKGEFVVVAGASGAGKSTILNILGGMDTVSSGEVIVDNNEISKYSQKELITYRRYDIGFVFQFYNLVQNLTARENVELAIQISKNPLDIDKVLDSVGLANRKNNFPSQLSGGQKQRVGIARALANDTKVLLCDEATSALDPQTTKAILELIRDINKKLQLTVVVITHEMQVIKDLCDKVAVLDHGVIAENGTVLEIFTNPKEPITKEFMSVLSSNELPAAYRNGKVHKEYIKDATMLLRLTFIGESADNPVIAGLIRKFPELDISILFGDLSQIQMVQFGRMIIGLDGKEDQIKDAIKSLMEQDLKVEVIGYVQRRTHATA